MATRSLSPCIALRALAGERPVLQEWGREYDKGWQEQLAPPDGFGGCFPLRFLQHPCPGGSEPYRGRHAARGCGDVHPREASRRHQPQVCGWHAWPPLLLLFSPGSPYTAMGPRHRLCLCTLLPPTGSSSFCRSTNTAERAATRRAAASCSRVLLVLLRSDRLDPGWSHGPGRQFHSCVVCTSITLTTDKSTEEGKAMARSAMAALVLLLAAATAYTRGQCTPKQSTLCVAVCVAVCMIVCAIVCVRANVCVCAWWYAAGSSYTLTCGSDE